MADTTLQATNLPTKRKMDEEGSGDMVQRRQSKSHKHNNGAAPVKDMRLSLHSKSEQTRIRRHKDAIKQYGRGKPINVDNIRDRKLRRHLGNMESRFEKAADQAKDAEVLLENESGFLEPETEMERTYKVRQDEIAGSAPISAAQKRFDLKLDSNLGPYMCEFTRTGRELLLAGRRGHVATMDWREGKLGCELQLKETVRDARWLHNNQYFAVAQKKYVYVYDHNGVEIHCLRRHLEVSHMEFLPYHFLLGTMSLSGQLKYQDVSTGQLVSEIHTKSGTPVSLAQNPYNAVLHAGHQNGTVTLWSPNISTPLVKLLAHKGPVRAMAIERQGRYMVSAGQDCRMSVWDVRMFKGEVSSYRTGRPGSTISISDKGLTAVGCGTKTTIWKDLLTGSVNSSFEPEGKPYLTWGGDGHVMERLRFCPYEDVLGVTHEEGFSSLIVPGAGEANFDALEVNPYETKKQRQEGEVKALLNKLKPEMIALDPNYIGKLDLRSDAQRRAEKDLDGPEVNKIEEEVRNRMRGKNSAMKKFIRKQKKRNIIDETKLKAEEMFKEQQERRGEKYLEAKEELGPALGRFARKE